MRVRLDALLTAGALDDLDPEEVQHLVLGSVGRGSPIELGQRGADLGPQPRQRSRQVADGLGVGFERGDRARDGVDIDADDIGAQAPRLDDRRPAADERVQDCAPGEIDVAVVAGPEVSIGRQRRGDEQGAKRASRTAREPLVRTVVRAWALPLPRG